jgi:hypothetical protein
VRADGVVVPPPALDQDPGFTRHAGYRASQRARKRIEEVFGWLKTVAGQRKTRFRPLARVGWAFTFALAAYNLAGC